jgi:hypothetical protein
MSTLIVILQLIVVPLYARHWGEYSWKLEPIFTSYIYAGFAVA